MAGTNIDGRINVLVEYFNQPPDHPDAVVWAEIHHLIEVVGGQHFVVGMGDGEWALWNTARCGSCDKKAETRLTGMALSPRVLLNKLRRLASCESETAARKAAEEILVACEARLHQAIEVSSGREAEIDRLQERCQEVDSQLLAARENARATEEKAATQEVELTAAVCSYKIAEHENKQLREQVSELRGRRWLRKDSLRLSYYVGRRDDGFCIMTDHVHLGTTIISGEIGSGEPYETHSEAQGVLDKHAEEHDWDEVKTKGIAHDDLLALLRELTRVAQSSVSTHNPLGLRVALEETTEFLAKLDGEDK